MRRRHVENPSHQERLIPNIRHGGGVDPGTGRPSSVRFFLITVVLFLSLMI